MMQETDDPFRGQKPIELLPLFINNTGNWSIFQAPGVPKYQFLLWSATGQPPAACHLCTQPAYL